MKKNNKMAHASDVFGSIASGCGYTGGRGLIQRHGVTVEIGQYIRPSGKMSQKNIHDAQKHIETYLDNLKKWGKIQKEMSPLCSMILRQSGHAVRFSLGENGNQVRYRLDDKEIREYARHYGGFWNENAEKAYILAYGTWCWENSIEAFHYAGKRAEILAKQIELAEKYFASKIEDA